MSKSVALHTLGCKLNFSETTALGRMLEKDGFVKKDFDEIADVYVINTCSVTENANKECRQLVRRIQKKSPEAMVVVTGCYAQLKPQEIANIPGVNLVLGASEKFNIVEHLKEITKDVKGKICSCDIEDVNHFSASFSTNERTRVFLKVQDGCDYNCSFCTIPLARGKSRSDLIEQVLNNIHELSNNGVQEIVLTGINLGDFGKGIMGGKKKEETFFDLMKSIEINTNIQRFRISSIEPNLLNDDMIEFIATSKRFMPHFHLPLQSGSNKILAKMKRRYQKELYINKIMLIKNLMPHACIGADVIVGFPDETEEDFLETYSLIQMLDISYLHVFTYSEREDTAALSITPSIPKQIRNNRNKMLRNLSYAKMQDFIAKHIGQNRKVLFESANKNGMMEGFSDNYIKVSTPYNPEWENKIMDWII